MSSLPSSGLRKDLLEKQERQVSARRRIASGIRRAAVLIAACAAALAARAEKLVVGHQMLAMPRYGGATSVEQMREEIQQWKDLGLDGTMLFDIGSDAFRNSARQYHQAGMVEGYRFAISTSYFPSSETGSYSNFLAELAQPATSAARLTYNGRPYLSAYHAPGHFQDLVNGLRSVYGIETFAEPQMFPRVFSGNAGSQPWESGGITGMSAESYAVMMDHPAWSQVNGFAAFEITKSIPGQADAISLLWDYAHAHGKTARASIVPYYKGLAHKGNWMVYEGWGFDRLRTSWRRAIECGVPAVELITLNDFAESSYINSWAQGDPVILVDHWNKGDVPALLDHSGFRYFSKRYVEWFKTGREPAITQDELYYAYRLHPRDATSYYYLSAQEKATLQQYLPAGVNADWIYRKDGLPSNFSGWGPNWSMGIDWSKFSDGIHVAVRLTAPADVYINGTKVGSNLPAGEHLLVKPGSRYDGESGLGYPLHTFTAADFGRPRFEIRRNGATVLSHEGELEITPYPVPGCWNIFARRAPSPGGATGAAPVAELPAPEPAPVPTPIVETPSVPVSSAPFGSTEIGSPALAGSTTYDASTGKWEIRAAGADIWDKSDEFRFAHDAVTGDAELIVRVRSLTAVHEWTKAGLMFRAAPAANAAHVSVFVTPAKGVCLQWRESTGGSSSTSPSAAAMAPQWLKLARAGNTFTAYRSADGSAWELVHRITLDMPAALQAGLAVTSHDAAASTLATFDGYRVELPAAAAEPVADALTSSDIGAPALAGTTERNNGVYTLRAGGSDIWGTSDQFRFARRDVAGDSELTVKLTSVSYVDYWTKAGLMYRGSTGANAAYVGLFVSPGAGVSLQWRLADGASATYNGSVAGGTPRWLRLVRSGATFTGYHSADGVTWTKVGSVAVNLAATVPAGLALTSHNASKTADATFESFAASVSSTDTQTPAPAIPALTSTDIGAPALAGSASVSNGVYAVRAGGADIWGTSDQFHFVPQTVEGDAELTVRLLSVSYADHWTKAGLMFRGSASANAAFVGLYVSPGAGISLQWRLGDGQNATFAGSVAGTTPRWLRLVRAGTTFTGYHSADGVTWTKVGSVAVGLPSSVPAGLAVTSHNVSSLAEASFDSFSVNGSSGSGQTPAPVPPPAPALTSGDIGAPAISGSAALSDGVYTVRAGGADIWGTSDQFHFVPQTAEGDAEMIVRVRSVTFTNHWTKAGLMFRNSLNANAAFVGLYVSPGAGVSLQWRDSAGQNARSSDTFAGATPRWLRLVRAGTTFTGYHSADGSTWTKVGSATVALANSVPCGLALTSHDVGVAATAVMDNFTLKGAAASTTPVATPPAGATAPTLTGGDIGGPGLAGSYEVNGSTGVHTVRGSGNDIWNVSDQFQFARATIQGDSELTVRLSSLTNTDPWAKAGLMYRASAQGNAAFVAVLATPGNGLTLHWRKTAGAAVSSSAALAGGAPRWLRLMRDVNRFYAFASTNGADWTLVEYVDVELPASALGGLVACAHNTTALTTAVFDQFTVD